MTLIKNFNSPTKKNLTYVALNLTFPFQRLINHLIMQPYSKNYLNITYSQAASSERKLKLEE